MKFEIKKLIIIFSALLITISTSSCGKTTSTTTAGETVVETAADSDEELSSWDRYYLLSEKEQIEESKDSDYSELDYGTWDEYEVLKFMTFICEDEPSSWFPYGSMSKFVDTSKLTKYKSALIAYYCIPGAGSTGVINISVRVTDKNKVYKTNVFTGVHDYFGFENLELKGNQVNFAFSGYSKSDLGLCCRDIKDTGKIYYKNGFPVMEFTSFNDYRLKIYNLNYGPVFESYLFNLLTWGDNQVYSQDEVYKQSDKYNLKTGEVGDDDEAIIKKACLDFSSAIPKTDLANPGAYISIDEVQKMVTNWKKAATLVKDLDLPSTYMKIYIEIASTEVISDDAWLEGLREFNMLPKSEMTKIYDSIKIAGSKINKQSNKTCAKYDLFFVAPNDSTK